ncbi:MAG: hypothetical protein AAF533_00095 [Acidobacteriota bacterium]
MTRARSLFVPALALTLSLALPSSSSAQQDGGYRLLEDLRVATARLEFALEQTRLSDGVLGVEQRRERKILVRRSRSLMKNAAAVGATDTVTIEGLVTDLRDTRQAVLDWYDGLSSDRPSPERKAAYRSAFMEVLKYRDVATDVQGAVDSLSLDERARLAELLTEGEGHVSTIRNKREVDHVGRQGAVMGLINVRSQLADMLAGTRQLKARQLPFVPQARVRTPWTDVGYSENGFTALRARFVRPGSAFLTVRNDADETRHLFVEVELTDVGGVRTGSGVFETADLEEFRAGEVREVLIPIEIEHRDFWNLTRQYSLYLD